MVSAIKNLKNDESGSDVCIIFFLTFFIIVFVIELIIFTICITFKKKKLAILSIIISIVLILSVIGILYYDRYLQPNEIEYELQIKVNQTGNYTLFVPYLDNSNLKSELKIKDGNGEIEFIIVNQNTIQGSKKAIKVSGKQDLTIYGKTQDHSWAEMTLWTGEHIKHSEIHWVWCNKTNINQNISIQIIASIEGRSNGDDWKTIENQRLGFIYLNNGWNELKIEFGGWA